MQIEDGLKCPDNEGGGHQTVPADGCGSALVHGGHGLAGGGGPTDPADGCGPVLAQGGHGPAVGHGEHGLELAHGGCCRDSTRLDHVRSRCDCA